MVWTTYLRLAAITAGLPCSKSAPINESQPASPRVDLEYASYTGTTLENGVHQFLGMRYAAPPIGNNRFRRAQDPLNETSVVSAMKVSRIE
jgi:acetylcholinesterase